VNPTERENSFLIENVEGLSCGVLTRAGTAGRWSIPSREARRSPSAPIAPKNYDDCRMFRAGPSWKYEDLLSGAEGARP
jgi:hypothetical protein